MISCSQHAFLGGVVATRMGAGNERLCGRGVIACTGGALRLIGGGRGSRLSTRTGVVTVLFSRAAIETRFATSHLRV